MHRTPHLAEISSDLALDVVRYGPSELIPDPGRRHPAAIYPELDHRPLPLFPARAFLWVWLRALAAAVLACLLFDPRSTFPAALAAFFPVTFP